MTAYYNDHDPKVCAWLRELVSRGLIAPGDVDERSILDVTADDLRGYTQCHFFAGIGGWSYALRLAGWPDDRPVWTGSPPCQPFSAAGLQKGKDDARHLAPHFAALVAAGRPAVLFGEQVASAAVFGKAASGSRKRARVSVEGRDVLEWAWLDDLFDRLEAAHYACGASDIPAAGVGAPHIRQRCFFGAVRVADAHDAGSQGRIGMPERAGECAARAGGLAGGLADAERRTTERHRHQVGSPARGMQGEARQQRFRDDAGHVFATGRPRTPDSPWRDADWIGCRDGKWRPVEPGTFPLAHGVPARVGRLRGYGNAIVPQAAAAFVRAFGAGLMSAMTTDEEDIFS